MVPAGQAQKSFTIQPAAGPQPGHAHPERRARPASAATAPLTVDPGQPQPGVHRSNEQLDGQPTPNIFSGGTPQVGSLLFNGNAPSRQRHRPWPATHPRHPCRPASTVLPGQLADLQHHHPAGDHQHAGGHHGHLAGPQTVSVKMTLQPPPSLPGAGGRGRASPPASVVIFRWHTPARPVLSAPGRRQPRRSPTRSSTSTPTPPRPGRSSSLPSGKLYWRVLGVDAYGVDGPAAGGPHAHRQAARRAAARAGAGVPGQRGHRHRGPAGLVLLAAGERRGVLRASGRELRGVHRHRWSWTRRSPATR